MFSVFFDAYGSDERLGPMSPGAMTVRQQRVVSLHLRNYPTTWSASADYACSASVIGPHAVLTAAHCVSGPPSQPNGDFRQEYDEELIKLCTKGNATSTTVCTDVLNVFLPQEWIDGVDDDNDPATSPIPAENYDIAVVETAVDLAATVGSLGRENTPGGIAGQVLNNAAYPLMGNLVGGSCEHPVVAPGAVEMDLSKAAIYRQDSAVVAMSNGLVDSLMASVHGMSGSPVYWCPQDGNATCTGSENARIIGVLSGPAGEYVRLVSVPARYGWIQTQLNTIN